ncbi:leukocyte cysteine proteinase inhibitor 1-like [Ambystoma mexicanum]|uniref:leukocyte cysteine proteinase inhibitor 1-like n=1 Tax=Ambystoma mexicanum TaxID=8296 RepID=UPI0037E969A2
MPRLVGGYTEDREATPEVQAIADQVKEQVEKETGQNFETFCVLNYRSQLVNGTNYLMKIGTGGDSYVHARVHVPFANSEDSKPTLTGVLPCKKKEDQLEIF